MVPKLNIRGRWDQSLQVHYPDGTQQLLWEYTAPDYVENRSAPPTLDDRALPNRAAHCTLTLAAVWKRIFSWVHGAGSSCRPTLSS